MGIIFKILGSTKGLSFMLVFFAVMASYIAYLEIRISSLKVSKTELEVLANSQGEEIAQLVVNSQQNKKEVLKLKEDYKNSLMAMKKRHQKKLKQTKQITKAKEKINHAKETVEDGAVAPVMSDALDSLYQLQANSNQD